MFEKELVMRKTNINEVEKVLGFNLAKELKNQDNGSDG